MTNKKQSKNKEIGHKKRELSPAVSIEELDKKIVKAEKRLREMGIEKDVWVKKPIDVDPSFHFFFTKLKDPEGMLMLKQHAGATMRLLDAPPYLKRGAVKHLDDLVEFVLLGKKKTDEEKKLEPEKFEEPEKPEKAGKPKKPDKPGKKKK